MTGHCDRDDAQRWATRVINSYPRPNNDGYYLEEERDQLVSLALGSGLTYDDLCAAAKTHKSTIGGDFYRFDTGAILLHAPKPGTQNTRPNRACPAPDACNDGIIWGTYIPAPALHQPHAHTPPVWRRNPPYSAVIGCPGHRPAIDIQAPHTPPVPGEFKAGVPLDRDLIDRLAGEIAELNGVAYTPPQRHQRNEQDMAG